ADHEPVLPGQVRRDSNSANIFTTLYCWHLTSRIPQWANAGCATFTQRCVTIPTYPSVRGSARPEAKLPQGFRWSNRIRSLAPEVLTGPSGAFGQGLKLGPRHGWMNSRLRACKRAEAAIGAGKHILLADDACVALDSLRNQVRMLDEVRDRVDHARDQQFAIG